MFLVFQHKEEVMFESLLEDSECLHRARYYRARLQRLPLYWGSSLHEDGQHSAVLAPGGKWARFVTGTNSAILLRPLHQRFVIVSMQGARCRCKGADWLCVWMNSSHPFELLQATTSPVMFSICSVLFPADF